MVAAAPAVQFDRQLGGIVHRSHLALIAKERPEVKNFLVSIGSLGRLPLDRSSDRLQFDAITEVNGWKLREYQHEGREFIRSRRGTLLADAMRVGKSCQAIASHDPELGPLLVVAPLATREVWLSWFRRRWPEIRPVVLSGRHIEKNDPQKPRRSRLDRGFDLLEGDRFDPTVLSQAQLIFCNYDIIGAWKDLNGRRIGTLVLDEIHLVSQRSSRRAEAITFTANLAERVVAATGTPIWNKPAGLFTTLSCVAPAAFGKFFEYAVRYCLRGSTGILRHDGSYTPIEHLRPGDWVMGWSFDNRQRIVRPTRVLNHWTRHAETYRVSMESGREVVCTADHHWLSAILKPSPKQYRPLFAIEHDRYQVRRPLTKLLNVAPPPVLFQEDDLYKLGYIRGLLDGDGTVSSKPHQRRCVISSKETQHLEIAAIYGQELGLKPNKLYKSSHGMWQLGFYRTSTHRELTAHRRTEINFRRGWLAGIWDAEGTDNSIAQYVEVNPDIHKFIIESLEELKFVCSGDKEAIRILGGRREVIRFLGETRPKLRRKIDHVWTDNGYNENDEVFDLLAGYKMGRPQTDRILKIEPTGLVETVHSIKTETGNYIAEGYGSKNCNAHPGAHGYVYDGASNEDEFRERMSEIMIRRTWRDVASELPPIERSVEAVVLSEDQQFQIEKEAERVRDHSKRTTAIGALARFRRLVARHKVDVATDTAKRILQSGEKVVVWTWHQDVALRIEDHLSKAGFPGVVMSGSTSMDLREDLLNRWRNFRDPSPLVITLSVGQVGIDLSAARHAVFAELDFTPSVVAQAEMRTFSPLRPMAATYVIIDHDIDRRILAALQDKCDVAYRMGVPAAESTIGVLASAFARITDGSDDFDALARAIMLDHPDINEDDDYHGSLWDYDWEKGS